MHVLVQKVTFLMDFCGADVVATLEEAIDLRKALNSGFVSTTVKSVAGREVAG